MPRDLLRRLTSADLTELMALELLEPDGFGRVCVTLAMGFSAVLNAWGGRTKPEDFLPEWGPDEAPDVARLRAWAESFGGADRG